MKQDLSGARAFPYINKCQSYLKVKLLWQKCHCTLKVHEMIIFFILMSVVGERTTSKFIPNGVPMITEEGNSNTETVRSSEPTNLPTQAVEGTLDSDSIIRIGDKQPKKRKSVPPRASAHKKRVCYDAGETIENAIYEMFSAVKLKALERHSSNERSLYQKCLEELQQLEELDDAEFTKSVNVLKDDKNAIAFMTIKGPRRLIWLRSLWT